jgi:transposase
MLATATVRLERAIAAAVETAPAPVRAVITALRALRGIAQLSAVTIVTEVGALSRFARPRQLTGYSGAVAREHSSGPRTQRGGITKTGNAHLRRVAIEAVTTMTASLARSANIRVINRRCGRFDRHLLGSSATATER